MNESVLRAKAGSLASRFTLASAVAAACCLSAVPASTNTQTLLWEGAERIAVLCLIDRTPVADYRSLEAELCARMAAEIARTTPMPVLLVTLGDPQITAQDTVTLLVHAAVEPASADQPALLAMSVRPYRASSGDTTQLFGSGPRAVPLGPDGGATPALDRAITTALNQILPWRAKAVPFEGQPIHQ